MWLSSLRLSINATDKIFYPIAYFRPNISSYCTTNKSAHFITNKTPNTTPYKFA
ncbi:hypothetical protein HPHPH27_1327 [Helicobacter pylori Hp H-27]|nr:hypothetical protein HPHPH27_1327 [Helicobacter pylori Hp H-27]